MSDRYATAFSTASRDLVTRHDIVDATDDQLEVLSDIERRWGTIVAKHYHYAFRLLVENGEVEGWKLSIWNRETHTVHWKEFSGFPGSALHVFQAQHLLFEQMREREREAEQA